MSSGVIQRVASLVTLERAGTDFSQVIENVSEKIGADGLIQAYVNLGDKAAPEAVTELREKGYIFGGLLPLWFGSDGIIMQKLPREPDWEGIRLRHKESRNLLEYLRADYDTVNL